MSDELAGTIRGRTEPPVDTAPIPVHTVRSKGDQSVWWSVGAVFAFLGAATGFGDAAPALGWILAAVGAGLLVGAVVTLVQSTRLAVRPAPSRRPSQ